MACNRPIAVTLILAALALATPPAWAHNPGSVEIAQLTEVLKEDPEDVPVRRKRAELYIAFGDHEDALADCARLMKLRPKEPWIHALAGRAHALAEDYKKATASFTKAMAMGDKSQNTLVLRAAVYRDLEAYDKAVADLTAALKVEKQYAVYYERATIYMALGRYKLAVADFEVFLKVQPSSILFENLAKACLGAGNPAKAMTYVNKAVEKTAKYPWNYLLRARIHRAMKKEEKARADLATALAKADEAVDSEYGPSAFDLSLKAEILVEMGRLPDARAVLDTAVEVEPDMPILYEKRAVLLDRLGKAEEAKKDRRKAIALRKKLAEEKKKRR